MGLIPATLTNAITNGLHAIALLVYYILAQLAFNKRKRETSPFRSPLVVLFFLFLLIQKILAVFVHYFDLTMPPTLFKIAWAFIGLFLLLTNYCILYGMNIPAYLRRICLGISFVLVVLTWIYDFQGEIHFEFLALAMLVTYSAAVYYTSGWVRYGFIGGIVSNITWIVLRRITLLFVSYNDIALYSYDNDVFHLMLIASSFLIFMGIRQGQWPYSKKVLYF